MVSLLKFGIWVYLERPGKSRMSPLATITSGFSTFKRNKALFKAKVCSYGRWMSEIMPILFIFKKAKIPPHTGLLTHYIRMGFLVNNLNMRFIAGAATNKIVVVLLANSWSGVNP